MKWIVLLIGVVISSIYAIAFDIKSGYEISILNLSIDTESTIITAAYWALGALTGRFMGCD